MKHKIIYKNKWFSVLSKIKNKQEYFHIKRKNGVIVIAKDNQKNFYMVKTQRHALNFNTSIEMVRGSIEKNEDSLTAAKRELYEETGLNSHKMKKIGSFNPDTGFFEQTIDVFLADIKVGTKPVPIDTQEVSEVLIIHQDKLNNMIKTGEITDGLSLIALVFLNGHIDF